LKLKRKIKKNMKIKIKKYTLKHEIEILKNMKIKLKN